MKDFKDFENKWAGLLGSPDWYLTIVPDLEEINRELAAKTEAGKDAYKKEIYDFFELHLKNNDIALEKDPPDTDAERKPIDTIVIHHTSNPPGMSAGRLSAIELARLYAPQFYGSKSKADKEMKGRAIYSGHARKKRQVFWPYHWFVRKNGDVERLLEDPEIGWHAGDWDINCRSVAICFDDDYENSNPTDAELRAAAKLIKEHYSQVPSERIMGHREVNAKTTCPSNLFLSEPGRRGWKEYLLEWV